MVYGSLANCAAKYKLATAAHTHDQHMSVCIDGTRRSSQGRTTVCLPYLPLHHASAPWGPSGTKNRCQVGRGRGACFWRLLLDSELLLDVPNPTRYPIPQKVLTLSIHGYQPMVIDTRLLHGIT